MTREGAYETLERRQNREGKQAIDSPSEERARNREIEKGTREDK